MEAGECGLMRGTCFVARRLELVAVAGLLFISWCVLGAVHFFVFFFLFERTRPAASVMVSPFPSIVEKVLFLEEEEQSPALSEPICGEHSELIIVPTQRVNL